MQALLALCSSILLAQLVSGLFLISRPGRRTDKVLAAQLMATLSAALLVVMGETLGTPVLFDASLIFALLAVVSTVAFVRKAWTQEGMDP